MKFCDDHSGLQTIAAVERIQNVLFYEKGHGDRMWRVCHALWFVVTGLIEDSIYIEDSVQQKSREVCWRLRWILTA